MIITSSGNTPLTHGAQVIQVQAGDMRPSIDLEAGTQASDAMVQNMLWSLKDSDKTITNQILPSPAQRHDPHQVPAVDNGPQGREAELWPRRQPHLVLRRHNGEQ